MEELNKVKFTRIMRELCDFMKDINEEKDNIELRYNSSEDKFILYEVVLGNIENDIKVLDKYAAPMNFYVEM